MRLLFAVLLGAAACLSVAAHPMPNTEVDIRLGTDLITINIRVPAPELALAMPSVNDSKAVKAYFRQHMQLVSATNVIAPYEIDTVRISNIVDQNVGEYEELMLHASVPVIEGFDPRDFWLRYDAVIHQVPTHFALVKIVQDFDTGVVGKGSEVNIGPIQAAISDGSVEPFHVTVTGGSFLRGFAAMVSLGMEHILTGIDHILFLVTLLIVAPLAVLNGKWTLYRGLSYTVRRFLSISIAFTIGHSVSLILGTYELVSVNERFIEVAIAASILVTAVHAVRPIFSRREALVALAFGLVHGLAFSEVLRALQLAPFQKAISILGFNIGIELTQIIITVAAFPLLMLSKSPRYHSLRLATASLAVVIAAFWIVERSLA